ncbi:MAG: hypothetical protein NVSMB31_17430 [Vulcanimicrobiaceae bacterium]
MASDVIGLMDYLQVRKAALIGASDGANIGLDIAINHPERVTRLFAFAGNSNPTALKNAAPSATGRAFFLRLQREYQTLSPTPGDFERVSKLLSIMWDTQPRFTTQQLKAIHVPVWIVDGDHEQFIKRQNTDYMSSMIPGAYELILPGVSHGAPMQDPKLFTEARLDFLGQESGE